MSVRTAVHNLCPPYTSVTPSLASHLYSPGDYSKNVICNTNLDARMWFIHRYKYRSWFSRIICPKSWPYFNNTLRKWSVPSQGVVILMASRRLSFSRIMTNMVVSHCTIIELSLIASVSSTSFLVLYCVPLPALLRLAYTKCTEAIVKYCSMQSKAKIQI